MERKYSMYEGDDMNKIDLIHECSTSERNGVKVVIPVKYIHVSDFKKKIKEQLAYFENVFFDVEGMNNDFKIFRTEDYQYSELVGDEKMHICLDNVYYPIDYSKLGIPSIDVSIGLRFGLTDGIFPTPNREAIRYTSEAKAAIIAKVKKVCTQLVENFNEQHSATENIEILYDFHRFDIKCFYIGTNKINLKELEQHSSVKSIGMKFKNAAHDDFDYDHFFNNIVYFTSNYSVIARYNGRRFINHGHGFYLPDLWNKDVHSVDKEKLNNYDKAYIKSISPKNKTIMFVIKHQKNPSLRGPGGYHFSLNLNKHPKSEWRALIVTAQRIIEHAISAYTKPQIVTPKEFIDSMKKVKQRVNVVSKSNKRKRIEGEVNMKIAGPLEKTSSKSNVCKFVPTLVDASLIGRKSKFIIYAGDEHKHLLDHLYPYVNHSDVTIALVGLRDERMLKEANIHNCMHILDFLKGKTKVFKRLVTAHIIYNFIQKDDVNNLFIRTSMFSDVLPVGMREKLYVLDEYKRKHVNHSSANELFNKMLAHAEKNNLYDEPIYGMFLQLKAFLEKHKWLGVIYDVGEWQHVEVLKDVIVQLSKRNRVRLSECHYLKQ